MAEIREAHSVAVVTDSNSGVTQADAAARGLYVVPMPVTVDGVALYEGIDLTQEAFYEKIGGGAQVRTSMPTLETLGSTWKEALKTHRELVHITMAGALSSGCDAAKMLAEDFDGRVQVVDSKRVSAPMKRLVYAAAALAEKGESASEIKAKLEQTAADSVVYIAVDTLAFLQKGGRISAATAMIGKMLRIKPVLRLYNGRIEMWKKARTLKSAMAMMLEVIGEECANTLHCKPEEANFEIAYSSTGARHVEAMESMIMERYHPSGGVLADPLTISLACHIGPGAIGIGCTKKVV